MERALAPDNLPRLLRAVHAALAEHREEIDALNVFPVPDGDTGTNLEATAAAVVGAIAAGATDGPSMVRAALRSARGNSGVIFSQVVRAVIGAVNDAAADDTDGQVLARALAAADSLAREAVAEPVEGTILTALTVASATASEALTREDEPFEVVLGHVLEDVSQAVLATREQLEVLRAAGVVDAGARGFEVVVAAIQAALTGEDVEVANLGVVVPRCVDGASDDVDRNPFEVQFVLDGGGEQAARLRSVLGGLGSSVVVVEADGLVSAHVHTPEPDAAVEAGRQVGTPQDVRVTDLRAGLAEPVELAVVAVLPAGGLADLGRGSGAAVVEGAAGALPSVDDLVRAARSCPGDRVVLLPGHANVVPTARQAAELAAADGGPAVEVVVGATHPLVVLSCLAMATDDPETCREVVDCCVAGEVVAAVRDASTPVGDVRTGQPMVVVGGDVVGLADDVSQALGMLLDALGAAGGDVVTVAVGAEAGLDMAAVMTVVAQQAGAAELEVLDGGQRPALLLAAVEA